ncbi:uncharacterized protein [Hemitrygon akajei]|uniref:uncharacterized protein n=1 Tax=Hemitrygon akajei TaxID=2704970 RepID=UPI003BFA2A6F
MANSPIYAVNDFKKHLLNIRQSANTSGRSAISELHVYSQFLYHQEASSDNSCFTYLSSERQRILGRMDDSESDIHAKLRETKSRSPSRGEPDVSYAELNFKTLSAPRVQSDRGAQVQEPIRNIGNRSCRKISLLCLVTIGLCLVAFRLVAIVAGLSINVSQIRQSKVTSDRNYHELNSTLHSKLSALNSYLSVLKRKHNDLRHQFTEMETKYRSVNGTKARICEFLTSRREQTCPKNWNENRDRCYFISTLGKSYDGAREHCSNFAARLLEINSSEEEDFVSTFIGNLFRTYWIGKCKDGNVASYLLYEMFYGSPICSKCDSYIYSCNRKYGFICEKSAHLYLGISEDIQDLCQQTVGTTSIK